MSEALSSYPDSNGADVHKFTRPPKLELEDLVLEEIGHVLGWSRRAPRRALDAITSGAEGMLGYEAQRHDRAKRLPTEACNGSAQRQRAASATHTQCNAALWLDGRQRG